MAEPADRRHKTSFRYMLLRGAVLHNPLLVRIVGICPVVAVTTTLQTAVLLSAFFCVTFLITQTLTCLFMKKLPRFVRVCIYMLIGTAIILPLTAAVNTWNDSLLVGAGVYLPLLAVNSVTALHCEKFAVRPSSTLRLALFDAVATSFGFSLVALLAGALRELLGSGELWGKPLFSVLLLPALLMPFGGFLLLAVFAAALQLFTGHFFKEQAADASLKISKTAVHLLRPEVQPPTVAKVIQQQKETLPEQDTPEQPTAIQQEETQEEPEQADSEPALDAQEETAAQENIDLRDLQLRFQNVMEQLEQFSAGTDYKEEAGAEDAAENTAQEEGEMS